ncbi:membrane protein insertase YidC [Corynebacterium sp. UBA2622]|uniref:membrane protein insertase YidC n=1 Tax=Corynebacterium sp. UBA2622 TaxID=1946393 RepID=UPI0025C6D29F|nr:membrane protein insertase YidC [Corynebacterium sp. UBA2622]
MMEAFVYPVSAVMKLWHWLLASVFDVSSSHAWVASVILLVVTIRALIAPLMWITYKTNRQMVLMRPKLAAIEEKYGTDTTPEGLREQERARKEVHQEHSYNPVAGCLPAFIQMPFFLGLYRLLFWMALPDRAEGHSLGVLSPDDVASFQSASFFGVPLPAYVSMEPDQFELLGTTLADVRSVAVPMMAFAIFFTTFNLVLSQIRTRSTLQWDSRVARGMYLMMWSFVPLVPLSIGIAGMTGLVPIALLLYWFTGNLWTLVQTVVLWWLIVRSYPLGDDARSHIFSTRDVALAERREKKQRKRSRRRRRASALVRPSSLGDVRRELAEEKAALKRARAKKKAEKKELNRQRNEARKENMRIAREEAAKKRAEKQGETAPGGSTVAEPAQADEPAGSGD